MNNGNFAVDFQYMSGITVCVSTMIPYIPNQDLLAITSALGWVIGQMLH